MKRLFILLCTYGFLSLCVAQDAHFYLKNGMQLTWELSTIDSITYVKPDAEVLLPASCTLKAGSKSKFSYMVSEGIASEPIYPISTNVSVAYVYQDTLYAVGIGQCVIYTTYKGVTSSCVVTVEPTHEMRNLAILLSYAALATYSTAEIGAYLSQAVTTLSKTQTALYPYRNGWNFGQDVHPHMTWHNLYMIPAALQLQSEAEAKGYKNVSLIARTIQLMATMLATDLYGDLPEANMSMFVTPKYKTQQEIYDWMFKEVEDLLVAYQSSDYVNCSTNLKIDTQLDPIYGGDLSKWVSFCQALKARLWLRKLPNWDNTAANCQKIIAAVDAALTNWQDPLYQYTNDSYATACPWGETAPYPAQLFNNNLYRSIPTTFFLHAILGSIDNGLQIDRTGHALDPRASRMMAARGNRVSMLHVESNIGTTTDKVLTDFPNLYSSTNPYTQNTGYIALMTTEELMFIKAEAQYWAGDIKGAYSTTVEATKESMKRYGIEEDLLSDIDPNAYTGGALDQYHRFFNIKLPNANKFTIADLMQQKYAAMYLQPEQWTDMRRYNYSSSENGISYVHPTAGHAPVYVYDVKHVHNGRRATFAQDSVNFRLTYSLRRPYNLYEPYWWTADDFGVNASLSPNAWIMRINPSPTTYALPELQRLGYYTVDADERWQLNPAILRKRMIWAQKNADIVTCADNTPWK